MYVHVQAVMPRSSRRSGAGLDMVESDAASALHAPPLGCTPEAEQVVDGMKARLVQLCA